MKKEEKALDLIRKAVKKIYPDTINTNHIVESLEYSYCFGFVEDYSSYELNTTIGFTVLCGYLCSRQMQMLGSDKDEPILIQINCDGLSFSLWANAHDGGIDWLIEELEELLRE